MNVFLLETYTRAVRIRTNTVNYEYFKAMRNYMEGMDVWA